MSDQYNIKQTSDENNHLRKTRISGFLVDPAPDIKTII